LILGLIFGLIAGLIRTELPPTLPRLLLLLPSLLSALRAPNIPGVVAEVGDAIAEMAGLPLVGVLKGPIFGVFLEAVIRGVASAEVVGRFVSILSSVGRYEGAAAAGGSSKLSSIVESLWD